MVELVVLVLALAVGVATLGLIVLREQRLAGAERDTRQTIELRFPRVLSQDAVEAVLSGLAGLSRGTEIALDLWSGQDQLRHFISAPMARMPEVSALLRAAIPGAVISPVTETPITGLTRALAWSLNRKHGVLRPADAEMSSTALLTMMGAVKQGECLLLRWVVAPAGSWARLEVRRKEQSRRLGALALFGSREPDQHRREHVVAWRAKSAQAPLVACGLLASRAAHPERAAHLLAGPSVVLRSMRSPFGNWRARAVAPRRLTRVLERPRVAARGPLVAPRELAPVLGWPIGASAVPGLEVGGSRTLPPSPRIPSQGRPVGTSNHSGTDRRLAVPMSGWMSHSVVSGPTGSGKSALILNWAVSDLVACHGGLVLDGRGDLVGDLLERVPRERASDIVVLDLADPGPLPGLNVLAGDGDPELVADLVLGVFRGLFAESWGPRTDIWLRAGLVTLAHEPGSTLADWPWLFIDEAYRRRLVGRITDPVLAATWAGYEAMSTAERANVIAAPLNKVMQVIGRASLRAVIAQAEPKLSLAKLMAEGKWLIVSLASGAIGGPAAQLLGALLVWELTKATQARVKLPSTSRRPFAVYIDEPQVLTHLPVPVPLLFEQARGFGVGLTITSQSPAVLPPRLRQAVFTNAATFVSFRATADDAAILARELDGFEAEDLQNLGQYEVAARIGLGNGAVAPTVTARTDPPPPLVGRGAAIRRLSRELYGRDRTEIEAGLARRHQIAISGEDIGRERRTP